MPRYDYECNKCSAHEIIAHGFHDAGPSDCFMDNCNGTMRKVIKSAPAVQFNAKGFYSTGG